jgi:hypothetical protein
MLPGDNHSPGNGVFAKKDLKKGWRFSYTGIEYAVGKEPADSLYVCYTKDGKRAIDGKSTIAFANMWRGQGRYTGKNQGLFMEIGKEISVVLMRDVPKGEEICVDYGDNYFKDLKEADTSDSGAPSKEKSFLDESSSEEDVDMANAEEEEEDELGEEALRLSKKSPSSKPPKKKTPRAPKPAAKVTKPKKVRSASKTSPSHSRERVEHDTKEFLDYFHKKYPDGVSYLTIRLCNLAKRAAKAPSEEQEIDLISKMCMALDNVEKEVYGK